jgi:uncharacterized protein (DUF2147 family)
LRIQTEELSMMNARAIRGLTEQLLMCGMACVLVFLMNAGDVVRAQQEGGADAIVGEWVTAEGKARVLISKTDSAYQGKIVWLKEPVKNGKEVVDDKNPDPNLRSRRVLGMDILWGFSFDGEDQWTGGKIYDPENGSTYSAKMTLKDPTTLKLRGYVLIPLFGRSELWTR